MGKWMKEWSSESREWGNDWMNESRGKWNKLNELMHGKWNSRFSWTNKQNQLELQQIVRIDVGIQLTSLSLMAILPIKTNHQLPIIPNHQSLCTVHCQYPIASCHLPISINAHNQWLPITYSQSSIVTNHYQSPIISFYHKRWIAGQRRKSCLLDERRHSLGCRNGSFDS